MRKKILSYLFATALLSFGAGRAFAQNCGPAGTPVRVGGITVCTPRMAPTFTGNVTVGSTVVDPSNGIKGPINACVGTPGNTTGPYGSLCEVRASGALYACTNAGGCTVAGDWASVGGSGHTQNTDTGTTATCFQIDNDATGPKVCHDGAGGFSVKKSDNTVLFTVDANGAVTIGSGEFGVGGTCRNPASITHPSAGEYLYFCDSTNSDHLSVMNSSGSVTDLQTAGGSIATTTEILKGNNAGGAVAATAGTDYLKPGSTIARYLYLPLGGVNQTATGPASCDIPVGGPQPYSGGTSPHVYGGLDFPDGSDLTITCQMLLPDSWTSSGGVDLKYIWKSESTSTNSVVWTAATAFAGDGDDMNNPTYNTRQTFTATANKATAGQRNSSSKSGITITGGAAGKIMFFSPGRKPSDAGDNFGATATLVGIQITWRETIAQ